MIELVTRLKGGEIFWIPQMMGYALKNECLNLRKQNILIWKKEKHIVFWFTIFAITHMVHFNNWTNAAVFKPKHNSDYRLTCASKKTL